MAKSWHEKAFTFTNDGVAIRQLPSGALAIQPDSLLWAVARDASLLGSFSPSQVAKYAKLIEEDRSIQCIDQFEIHVSERCNLRCDYCYIPLEMRKSHSRMNREQLYVVFEKIRSFSMTQKRKPRIHFHGGEPGLYLDALKDCIKQYSGEFDFAMQTNGVSMREDDLIFLIRNSVDVGISLDSIHQSDHMARSGASTSKIIRSIRTIIEEIGDAPNVIITLTKNNIWSLRDTVRTLREMGVTSFSINPITAYTPGTELLRPDTDDLIKSYLETVEYALSITSSSKEGLFINNMEAIAVSILTGRSDSYCEMSPCGAGRLMAVISSDGSIFPCSGVISNQLYSCGNLFTQDIDIADALSSDSVKKFQERTAKDIPLCGKCAYREICGANCPIPYMNNGQDYMQPSTWCSFRFSLIDYVFNHAIPDPKRIIDFISHETRASFLECQYDSVSVT